jgi:hypothetical protein
MPPSSTAKTFSMTLVNVLYQSIMLVHQWSQRVYILDYSYNGKRHADFVLAKSEVSMCQEGSIVQAVVDELWAIYGLPRLP